MSTTTHEPIPEDRDNRIAVAEVLNEEADLFRRYGPMPSTREAVYYHVSRAFSSFQAALYLKGASTPLQRERVVHLAAVCIRAAEALS